MQLDELREKLNSVNPVIQIKKDIPTPIKESCDILRGFLCFKISIPDILELSLKWAIISPEDPSTILKFQSAKSATSVRKYCSFYLGEEELSDEELICFVLKQKEVLMKDKIMGDVLCQFTEYKTTLGHSSHNYMITR